MSSPFVQQKFLVAFVVFWPGSNTQNVNSRIRQRCAFICTAFKSRTEWIHTQRVSAPTTTILPTTAVTNYDFIHVIYEPQTSVYQNITKLLRCTVICAGFKSQTEWCNAQRVSAPTTMILPTTEGTFNRCCNFFDHVIFSPQISTYQHRAKLLTHPSILSSSFSLMLA